MNIAYILPLGTIVSNKSNGVRMQAAVWADELRAQGHRVSQIDIWGECDWKSFDIIHIFGIFPDVDDLIRVLSRKTRGVFVYSPIIDTNRPWYLSKLAGFAAFPPLHMTSPWSILRHVARRNVHFLARSEYEREYIRKSLGVDPKRIGKVMLPTRFADGAAASSEREDFCLHISILSGPHKNVRRLIAAAIKYDFRLVLAGKCGDAGFQKYLDDVVRAHPNIVCKGWVSDEEMLRLYGSARCFALPSIFEGVGLVALDAAACGCDIVLTDRGAPKEYYDGMVKLVNPESVDDIGRAVTAILSGESYQPMLSEYIRNNYSVRESVRNLVECYEKC